MKSMSASGRSLEGRESIGEPVSEVEHESRPLRGVVMFDDEEDPTLSLRRPSPMRLGPPPLPRLAVTFDRPILSITEVIVFALQHQTNTSDHHTIPGMISRELVATFSKSRRWAGKRCVRRTKIRRQRGALASPRLRLIT